MKKQSNQSLYNAFNAGQLAAYDGVPITSNPYASETYELYAEWVRGWVVVEYEQLEYKANRCRQRTRCY